MIECENKTDFVYPQKLLEDIARHLSDKIVELTLIDDAQMRAINREHRGIDKTTDVLSFPLQAMEGFPLGSLIISVDKVRFVAAELGHSAEDEMALLFIHGMLHLLGYDHEVDDGEMRLKEEEVVKHFGLPNSLILRNK